MKLTRIRKAEALKGFRLRLELTDGSVIERPIRKWMTGPVFAELRADPEKFAGVRVEGGTVTWPNGADLCPDLLIWGGPPPAAGARTRSKRTRVRRARETARR